MDIQVKPDKAAMGLAAARLGAQRIQQAIDRHNEAAIIVATGASQFEMLEALSRQDLPWHKVTAFHLDEYVGLDITHPASFRQYLWRRFVSRLSLPLRAFHYIDGQAASLDDECARLGRLIEALRIDVAFIGIGENGHLAFNDPPADFDRRESYFVADLDEACRRQQLGEGWFPTLQDVPAKAISMSIPRVMAARTIVCTVPDARKANAVTAAVKGPVAPQVPASILQRHGDCTLFLDPPAAAGL